jgi:methylated-DNA-[protein]-cysteine S-methyltransferase
MDGRVTVGVRRRVSPFEQRVYGATRQIPRGRVTTYALLASAIGCRSARAVGQALRRNPFAPRVPCHRVISSDLRLGGFEGWREGAPVRRKKALLAAEGVFFLRGRLADASRVFAFPKERSAGYDPGERSSQP